MGNEWYRSKGGIYTEYDRTDIDRDESGGPGYYRRTASMSVRPPTQPKANGYYTDVEQTGERWQTPEGQGMLFNQPASSPAKVDALFMDKSRGFRDLPSILGVAQFDAYQKWGPTLGKLDASSDLSPHSSRIVEHAKRAGHLSEDTPTRVTNDYDQTSTEDLGTFATRKSQRVSWGEMDRGKAIAKRILRPAKPAAPEQSEQQRLF